MNGQQSLLPSPTKQNPNARTRGLFGKRFSFRFPTFQFPFGTSKVPVSKPKKMSRNGRLSASTRATTPRSSTEIKQRSSTCSNPDNADRLVHHNSRRVSNVQSIEDVTSIAAAFNCLKPSNFDLSKSAEDLFEKAQYAVDYGETTWDLLLPFEKMMVIFMVVCVFKLLQNSEISDHELKENLIMQKLMDHMWKGFKTIDILKVNSINIFGLMWKIQSYKMDYTASLQIQIQEEKDKSICCSKKISKSKAPRHSQVIPPQSHVRQTIHSQESTNEAEESYMPTIKHPNVESTIQVAGNSRMSIEMSVNSDSQVVETIHFKRRVHNILSNEKEDEEEHRKTKPSTLEIEYERVSSDLYCEGKRSEYVMHTNPLFDTCFEEEAEEIPLNFDSCFGNKDKDQDQDTVKIQEEKDYRAVNCQEEPYVEENMEEHSKFLDIQEDYMVQNMKDKVNGAHVQENKRAEMNLTADNKHINIKGMGNGAAGRLCHLEEGKHLQGKREEKIQRNLQRAERLHAQEEMLRKPEHQNKISHQRIDILKEKMSSNEKVLQQKHSTHLKGPDKGKVSLLKPSKTDKLQGKNNHKEARKLQGDGKEVGKGFLHRKASLQGEGKEHLKELLQRRASFQGKITGKLKEQERPFVEDQIKKRESVKDEINFNGQKNQHNIKTNPQKPTGYAHPKRWL